MSSEPEQGLSECLSVDCGRAGPAFLPGWESTPELFIVVEPGAEPDTVVSQCCSFLLLLLLLPFDLSYLLVLLLLLALAAAL